MSISIEEMRNFLTGIQNESSQTKILNSILTCFTEIKRLEERIDVLSAKVDQIAEALNHDIKEDTIQSEPIDDYHVAASLSEQEE